MTTSRSKYFAFAAILVASASFATVLQAGEADVVDATVTLISGNTYRFDVSVAHIDTGWDHYANAFEIFDLQDNLLGTRILAHPHVDQVPFTRSVRIDVPEGITSVKIRAVDNVHGTGGEEMILKLVDN